MADDAPPPEPAGPFGAGDRRPEPLGAPPAMAAPRAPRRLIRIGLALAIASTVAGLWLSAVTFLPIANVVMAADFGVPGATTETLEAGPYAVYLGSPSAEPAQVRTDDVKVTGPSGEPVPVTAPRLAQPFRSDKGPTYEPRAEFEAPRPGPYRIEVTSKEKFGGRVGPVLTLEASNRFALGALPVALVFAVGSALFIAGLVKRAEARRRLGRPGHPGGPPGHRAGPPGHPAGPPARRPPKPPPVDPWEQANRR